MILAQSAERGMNMVCRNVLIGTLVLAVIVVGTLAQAADLVEIPLTIENHRFAPEEITVKAGASFALVISNKDATAEEFESHDLRIEKVIPAGKTLRLRMPALKKGTYGFVGDFNQSTAKGQIIAE